MRLLPILLFLACGYAFAGDHDDEHAPTVQAQSVEVGGNHSHALGLGGGDVDINDCYRSYSIIVWQGSRPNLWCMANDLDRIGRHHAAAVMRCSIRSVRKPYGTQHDCVDAMISLREPAPASAPVLQRKDDREEESLHADFERRLELIEEQHNRDVQIAKQAASQARRAAEQAAAAERRRQTAAQKVLEQLKAVHDDE